MAVQPAAPHCSLDSPALPMVLLEDFVAARYRANTILQRYYKSAEEYLYAYVRQYGLQSWLESLRGVHLDEAAGQAIARVYITHCKRLPREVRSILAGLERQFDIVAPAVEGILTVEYWENWYAEEAVTIL